jgi:hypothetical protein
MISGHRGWAGVEGEVSEVAVVAAVGMDTGILVNSSLQLERILHTGFGGRGREPPGRSFESPM